MKLLLIILVSFVSTLQIYSSDKLPVMLKVKSNFNLKNSVINIFRSGSEDSLTSQSYELISKKQQEEALLEQRKQQKSDCYDDACLVVTGRMMAAQMLFIIEVEKLDDEYLFKAKMINLETGSIKSSVTEVYKGKLTNTSNLLGFSKKITNKVLRKLNETSYEEKKEKWSINNDNEFIVEFNSIPDKAVVLNKGNLLCQSTPCSVLLKEGKYKIMMQKDRFEKLEFNLNVNKKIRITQKLLSHYNSLNVSSSIVGAKIKINNKYIGKTPVLNYEVSSGNYKIDIDDRCFYKTSKTVTVKKGEVRYTYFDLKTKDSGIKVIPKDKKGNVLEGKLYIDNKYIGVVPKTYKIPLCSKTGRVETNKGEVLFDLELIEKKVLRVEKVLEGKNFTMDFLGNSNKKITSNSGTLRGEGNYSGIIETTGVRGVKSAKYKGSNSRGSTGYAKTLGSLRVSGKGHMSQKAVQKAINKKLYRLTYCYEKALLSKPNLSGVIKIQWTITTKRKVRKTKIVKSQMEDRKLHRCLMKEISKIKFPRPKGGDVTVIYPFKFKPTL